jgi:uncharacterized protein YkwD
MRQLLIPFVTTAALAGCVVVPPSPPVVPGVPTVPAVATPASGVSASFLPLLNDYRQAQGLPAAVFDPRAAAAAEAHLADMLAGEFFSHTGSNGSDVGQRVRQQGLSSCRTAENIAAGNTTPAAAFAQWQGSAAHNANMLTTGDVRMGLAESGGTWVLVIARPC